MPGQKTLGARPRMRAERHRIPAAYAMISSDTDLDSACRAAHTRVVVASSPGSHANSTFRNLALVTSTVATLLFLLTAAAIARYGDSIRDFGWITDRVAGQIIVIRVDPGSPADGVLRRGDAIVAWNGDRRIARVGVIPFRRNLPRDPDARYSLTILRAGVEQTVMLSAPPRQNRDQWRLNLSSLVAACAWFVIASMIAFLRPELPVSRSAYAAGMLMGFFMLGVARASAMWWLPGWWKSTFILLFAIPPLHLAIGYDFYSRFPPGISTTRLWRGIRLAMYVLCCILFVFGTLIDTVVYSAVPDRAVAVRDALYPIDRWLQWPGTFVYLLGGLAIVAVIARNYRVVRTEGDKRKLRWVLWGTVVGLGPFIVLQMVNVLTAMTRTPFNFSRWTPLANLSTVVIPISFGYAVIKHHVFDITVVVRRGLQYLLAKNALRGLLALPIAGLVFGVVVHRDEPLQEVLWSNSVYLYLIAAAIVSLRFRSSLTRWVDKQFFREAYDRQRILVELIDNVEKLESASSVSRLVSHELEAAFHPQCLFVWYREADKASLTLSYSSGGYIHAVELSPASPLLQLAEQASGVIELPDASSALPGEDREWLDDSGVRLIVPMMASDRHLTGMIMLGDKKSEEPYSGEDLKLLQTVARQIGVAQENVRLKERVDHDRRLRHDVLAHLETGHVNVLKECPTCGLCYDAASSACSSDGTELTLSLPIERTIDGKYRIDRLIGKGGMGAVYEGTDLRLARNVAIKIMRGRSFGDRQALRRFEREAQACARLTHPNIITVFDYGAAGADGAFLVMELVRGRTLRHEIETRGHLPPALAAVWFGQICEAVAAAHERHVVHRDLKPENVLITDTGSPSTSVKVVDFGLAKMLAAGDETDGYTNPGVVMGTAGYMAPEQLMGREIDQRVDVFAIGVMATEAIIGRRPFRGQNYQELLASIANDPIAIGGGSAERRRVESILRRATAVDASLRYSSVPALAADLIPALRVIPVAVSDPDAPTIEPA